ncbi:hypothetical protein BJY00DRAFT_316439 [Aspergillus carlsbadensis]|nr:hypothetical protein BJY00DRAFT_316439 [Aspergillus carlsbadensis]
MANVSWLLPLLIAIVAIAASCYTRFWQSSHPVTTTQEQHKENGPPASPYNEDEIVQLMKDIYRTYLKLNYIKRWELVWPPAGGHAINEALCEELRLNPAVISLMKKLPYISDYSTTKDIEFYTYSRAMVYLEDDEIRGGRDPTFFEFQEPRLFHLLPHDITLICDGYEGSNIILDTRENTIRVEDFHDFPPGRDAPPDYHVHHPPERPDDEDHYRNFYPHHAPTWLASWLQKIRSLDVVPVIYGGYRSLYTEEQEDGAVVKRILQEKYGYPDNFREDEWRRVGRSICWQAGHCSLDKHEVPDTFEVDPRKEEEEARQWSETVAYAEEIDGPRTGL